MSTFRLPSVSADDAVQAIETGACLLDIRKPEAWNDPAKPGCGVTVAGATVRSAFGFDHTDPLTTAEGPIYVTCARGQEVSHFATALLLLHGRDARYVEGGLEALAAAGAPLVPLTIDAKGARA